MFMHTVYMKNINLYRPGTQVFLAKVDTFFGPPKIASSILRWGKQCRAKKIAVLRSATRVWCRFQDIKVREKRVRCADLK